MERIPTKFEIEHEKQQRKDRNMIAGCCVSLILIAISMILIG